MLRSCSLREQPEYKNHANHERPFNPDDDILVENVWFLLIVYIPFLSFLAFYIHQYEQ